MSMGAKQSNNDSEENNGKDDSHDATEDSEKQGMLTDQICFSNIFGFRNAH